MRIVLSILFSLMLTGCATSPVYNAAQTITPPETAFNESGFKAIEDGMTIDQAHQLMGTGIIIGYEYQAPDYKPVTIPNPYKSETIKGSDYLIEYYIEAIRQPDGVVSDNELMPLIFKGGKLIGRGWPLANSIRPLKPSA